MTAETKISRPSLFRRLGRTFLAGLLAALPLALTLAAIVWIAELIHRFLGPGSGFGKMLGAIGLRFVPSELVAYFIGVLGTLLLIYLLGLFVEAGMKNRWQALVDGLLNHVVNLETFDFDRHADVRNPLPVPRPRGMGFLDFPRHGGFYLGLWTAMHAKTGEKRYLDWSHGIIDHTFRSRDPKSGLPPGCTRTQRTETVAVESVLSLAVSLLEAAQLLPPGKDRDHYERVAKAYLDRILELPHRPDRGELLVSFRAGAERPELEPAYSDPYRYEYGGGFTADNAVLLLAAYRVTRDPRALRLAEGFAGYYAENDPPPPWEIVRAHTYASIIGLFVDLYDLTGKPEHLAQAERYGQLAVERRAGGADRLQAAEEAGDKSAVTDLVESCRRTSDADAVSACYHWARRFLWANDVRGARELIRQALEIAPFSLRVRLLQLKAAMKALLFSND